MDRTDGIRSHWFTQWPNVRIYIISHPFYLFLSLIRSKVLMIDHGRLARSWNNRGVEGNLIVSNPFERYRITTALSVISVSRYFLTNHLFLPFSLSFSLLKRRNLGANDQRWYELETRPPTPSPVRYSLRIHASHQSTFRVPYLVLESRCLCLCSVDWQLYQRRKQDRTLARKLASQTIEFQFRSVEALLPVTRLNKQSFPLIPQWRRSSMYLPLSPLAVRRDRVTLPPSLPPSLPSLLPKL